MASRARWAGWAVSIGLLVLAVWVLRGRWDAVGDAGGLPGVLPSLAAMAAYALGNFVLVYTWREVVAAAGPRLPIGVAAWVWSLSQLARYTVGAAQVGGRAVVGRRYGLTLTAGALSTLVEVGWLTSISAALMLATLPWWLPAAGDLTWLAWVGALPALVLVAGLVSPRGLIGLLDRLAATRPVARLTGGRLSGLGDRIALDRRGAVRVTGLYLASTGLRVAAFLGLFAAVGGDVRREGLLAVGAYALGQIIGRLAVFAPGGIGPREGATALAIAPAIGGGPALVLVAATRLLEIAAELLFVGFARVLRREAVRSG